MQERSYPLAWPQGWRRTEPGLRIPGRFSKKEAIGGSNFKMNRDLSVADGVKRVLTQLDLMGVRDKDIVISTNIQPRLDGFPRSDRANQPDPGAAVYWIEGANTRRVMAIDMYTTVADNLAAIAATLDAMRSIARHGSAEVLERAFTGFTALPGPGVFNWRWVLGPCKTLDEARNAYRQAAAANHPDRGGSSTEMAKINLAWKDAQREFAG